MRKGTKGHVIHSLATWFYRRSEPTTTVKWYSKQTCLETLCWTQRCSSSGNIASTLSEWPSYWQRKGWFLLICLFTADPYFIHQCSWGPPDHHFSGFTGSLILPLNHGPSLLAVPFSWRYKAKADTPFLCSYWILFQSCCMQRAGLTIQRTQWISVKKHGTGTIIKGCACPSELAIRNIAKSLKLE